MKLTTTEITTARDCCEKDPCDCKNCPAYPYPEECRRIFDVTMMKHRTVSKEYNE